MRILHFLPRVRAEVGGPARAVVDLCAELARRGHQVTLATTDGADAPPEWRTPREGAPRLVVVPAPTLPGGVFTRRGLAPLRELIRKHDLLHVHGVWELMGVQISREATRAGKPYFISVRGMLDHWAMSRRGLKKRVYLSLVGRRWLEGAARVHLTALGEFEQARTRARLPRPVIIPNLLDLTPYQSPPGATRAREKFPSLNQTGGDEHRPTVLFLSRIHPGKGLEHLLGAMRLLKDRGTPCLLQIAGSGDAGYVASIKRLAGDLGLTQDDFAFLGFVTGDLKLSLYSACDLFALATSQENFGLVLVESLACGTPVVTTRGVDIWPELEGSGGVVIADATAEAFADAIGELFGPRRSELPAMGQQGREWVFRELDPRRVIERFEAMYRLEV